MCQRVCQLAIFVFVFVYVRYHVPVCYHVKETETEQRENAVCKAGQLCVSVCVCVRSLEEVAVQRMPA